MSSAISTQLRFKPVPASGSVGRVKAQGVDWLVVIVLAAHVPLAILLSFSTILSTLHGVLTVAVGLFVAVQNRKNPERGAYAGAYMVGAEVLWSMTGSLLFWEVGKDVTAGVFLRCLSL